MKRLVTNFQVIRRAGRLSQFSLNLGSIFSKSLSSTSDFLHSASSWKLPPTETQEQQLVKQSDYQIVIFPCCDPNYNTISIS